MSALGPSIAAVLCALLVWDGHRRWLESCKVEETTLKLIKDVEHSSLMGAQVLARQLTDCAALVEAHGARFAIAENRLGELEAELQRCQLQIASLATAPAGDTSKQDVAIKNLAVQLKELSEHVDKEVTRERASRAAVLAGGGPRAFSR